MTRQLTSIKSNLYPKSIHFKIKLHDPNVHNLRFVKTGKAKRTRNFAFLASD